MVAIAAGAADGLGFGDNGKAGLLTRGLAEMTRLGIAAGANPLTFAGLAGMGDLIATCGSHLSRNHRLGEELAKGRTWAEIEATLPGTAEGAYTVQAALALAERLGVEMPIAREVDARAVRGQERPALPGRPARPRVEGRAGRLRPLGGAAGPGRDRRAPEHDERRRASGTRVLDSGSVGAWRSLVAHQSGGLVVVGSNPAAPTIFRGGHVLLAGPSCVGHRPSRRGAGCRGLGRSAPRKLPKCVDGIGRATSAPRRSRPADTCASW